MPRREPEHRHRRPAARRVGRRQPVPPNHTPEEIVPYRRAEFARILDDAAAPLADELQAMTLLIEGRAADAIVQAARKGIDLLFIGSSAYGALRRAIAGSTAAEVCGVRRARSW